MTFKFLPICLFIRVQIHAKTMNILKKISSHFYKQEPLAVLQRGPTRGSAVSLCS